MKKKIAILGSTGSIGKSLLKIIEKNKNQFEIELLTANENYRELIKQTRKFNVKNVIITNDLSYKKFKIINQNPKIKVYTSFDNLNKILSKKVDYTMSAIVGINGLEPTIKIIKFTKTIAIANKESIICGWNLISSRLLRYKTKFIPVDSEHYSIWYALNNCIHSNINKIFLTASGGPLLNVSKKKMKNIKIKDVLKHPNWKMGKKISVDSSTMMNKVFEVIEAKNIFDIKLMDLSILIHPSSYVHAIVNFKDGMSKVIIHETTMDVPISNSLYTEGNAKNILKTINIDKLNKLNFSKIDKKKFPAVKILNFIPKEISLFETALVSSNDELVRLYLNKKITYSEITKKLFKILKMKKIANLKKYRPKKVSDIINIDKYVRLKISSGGI
tara:strand:+ start:1906 stop:3069 length:1164 start_codon:yes stop_codon:yes gene_type:complete